MTRRLRQIACREWLVVGLLCTVITVVTVVWIGETTIYAQELEARRHFLHLAILSNQLPPGVTWSEFGADGTNVRVATVALAEWMTMLPGMSFQRAYKLIDCLTLLAALLLIYAYLKRWFVSSFALCGLMLFGSLMPLTMLLHAFHPWDRPSLLMWVVMILLILYDQLTIFLMAYLVAIAVKYDAIVAPGLYWLLSLSRKSFWQSTAISAALVLAGMLLYLQFLQLFPDGFGVRDVMTHVRRNVSDLLDQNLRHQVVIVHGSLGILCAFGWSRATREQRALAGFGMLLLVPHFLITNFQEVRAQMATIVLMLPCAVRGIEVAFNSGVAPLQK